MCYAIAKISNITNTDINMSILHQYETNIGINSFANNTETSLPIAPVSYSFFGAFHSLPHRVVI